MASRQVQWRRFAFFEKETLIENLESEVGAAITCIACHDTRVVVGDESGKLTIGVTSFEKKSINQAKVYNGRVDAVSFSGSLVWAVGTETMPDQLICTVVKAWSDLPLETPAVSINTSVHHEGPAALTAFSVSSDNSQVACGFADGSVLLYKSVSVTKGGASLPPQIIKPSIPHPSGISALFICNLPNQSSLFICREEREDDSSAGFGGDGITCFNTKPGSAGELVTLDERGCGHGCATLNKETNEIMVGRSDGVFFYTSEDRGGAAGFEGIKEVVGCLSGGFILVASVDSRSTRTGINIYDLRNKFIAFHLLLPQDTGVMAVACRGVWEEGAKNLAYIITTKGSLILLKERDTSAKLDLLYKKNLYPVAISLAYASDCNVGDIMDIYRMYGDHLYRKGDFESAVQQYQHTIGHLEPSYVIRKYLDAQRITHLTQYLEALHNSRKATSNHTTLLLNCYTKLKDEKKLNHFIFGQDDTSGSKRALVGGSKVQFDVETALRVLKSAGYCDHAAALAERHQSHEWYVRIQLERPQPSYGEVLTYIGQLPLSLAESFLKRHGKALVSNLPEDATSLLTAMCTGNYKLEGPGNSKRCRPEDFIHLFVDHPKYLRSFLMCMVKDGGMGKPSPAVCDTLLELLLREWGGISDSRGSMRDDIDLLSDRRKIEDEIMDLLGSSTLEYDVDHALVLTLMLGFKPGQLYLYEKLNMTGLILEHYMNTGSTRGMIRICMKEGAKSPDLWATVLSHLVNRHQTQNPDSNPGWDDIQEVLGILAKEHALPPMEVLGILSENSILPFWIARDYMKGHLAHCAKELQKNELGIKDLRKGTTQMRAEISALRLSSRKKNSSRVQDASEIGLSSEKNSSIGVQPVCFPLSPLPMMMAAVRGNREGLRGEFSKYDDIKKAQAQMAGDHEQFYKDLEESTDGFSQIAEYFGKGLIGGICTDATAI